MTKKFYFVLTSQNGILFKMYFESFAIEEQVESLVYDEANFWAAVGGNLGLFLGFSCLSLLFDLIKPFDKFKLA